MADLRWLDVAEADGWADFARLSTMECREAVPDDRAVPAEEWREAAKHAAPAHRRLAHALAVDGEEAVGAAALAMDDFRPQSAWLPLLFVTPEHRGQGIGTRLLDAVTAAVRADGRNRIRVSTVFGSTDGARFAQRAGGQPGLLTEQNRCPTARLDVEQLRGWRDRAADRAAGYSLVAFDGVCPKEHLDALVATIPIMNTAPRTETTEEITPTRDQVREAMASAVRQGTTIWTVCARDDSTGAFVGYTELFFPRHRPWLAAQGDTGVHPDHRRRGIGRWLKAETSLRILAERPQVEFIETWNAGVNAPMLSINRAIGFRVVTRRQDWDVPVCSPNRGASRPRL